jgi:hypothetical protein
MRQDPSRLRGGLLAALALVAGAACAAVLGMTDGAPAPASDATGASAETPPVDGALPTPLAGADGSSVAEATDADGEVAEEEQVPRLKPKPPAVPAEILSRVPVFPRIGWHDVPSLRAAESTDPAESRGSPLVESVSVSATHPHLASPLRVEYTLGAELNREVYEILKQSRVQLGHVVVLDPASGDLIAFTSTDLRRLPATGAYPAASLVKVVTAAAALEQSPAASSKPCRYVGSPYRLTRARLDPPRRGREVSLERALATSNNQCFAQLAVHELGPRTLLDAIERFGLLDIPAPAHPAGVAEDPGLDAYALGKLGCGLAGLRITPLHAALLGATLAQGKLPEPRWIARVSDARGRELTLPALGAPRTVLSPEIARQLRHMLIETTTRGTARKGFRTRGGRMLVRDLGVAGKTGSLSGKNPDGRYEWFVGVSPADDPRLAIAVLVVQGRRWHVPPSRIAAEVLEAAFCTKRSCTADAVARWIPEGSGNGRERHDEDPEPFGPPAPGPSGA